LKKKELPDMVKQSVSLNPSESHVKPSSIGVNIRPQHIDSESRIRADSVLQQRDDRGSIHRGGRGGRH
jgi:hypothetical protein